MANDPIDLAALLAPLETGEQGAGTDLRQDFSAASLYQKLRDARSSARAEERARDAEGGTEGPEAAGWRDVLSIGQKALSTQSKDFEIAAWLTEALVRLHGLPGLDVGARLLSGLCETYWDTGFPKPDEDGLEGRASPIGGLSGGGADGTILQPLRRLPLFRRTDGSGLGLYQWDQSEQAEALNEERRAARYAAGTAELKTLETEARLDKAFLVGTGRSAAAALRAWQALETASDARFGRDAPSLRKVTDLLQRIVNVVVRLGGGATTEEEPAAAVPGDAAAAAGAGAAPVAAGRGSLLTRDDALRELDRIAEFFRRTEPHSPLAYTLDDAVRRGRLSLAELLAEVLPDEETRNAMLSRLGIRPLTD
jgi:type VI secretion system protein ImpA